MLILNCMKKSTWESVRTQAHFGHPSLESEGFIHCSTANLFWRVAPRFRNETDELVLLCIDTEKLESEVRFEDGDNVGRFYPHVYGQINTNAVVNVLPYIKDENGDFVKNEELRDYPNE